MKFAYCYLCNYLTVNINDFNCLKCKGVCCSFCFKIFNNKYIYCVNCLNNNPLY